MSRSLSSAGIQIEKARNWSGTDDEETPVGSDNRHVGLKSSMLTGDTNSSQVKGNVIMVYSPYHPDEVKKNQDLNQTKNLEIYP